MNDTNKIKEIIKKLSYEHHLSVSEIAGFLEVDILVVNKYLDIIENDDINNVLKSPHEKEMKKM